MAVFNPEIPFQNPQISRTSTIPRGNDAAAAIGAGLGRALEGAVAAAETATTNRIESELTAGRDQLFEEFGITGMIDNLGNVPAGVKASTQQMATLQEQLSQGAISPTQFYTRAGALASQVRAKYPNWRKEVDAAAERIYGFDSANRLASELMSAHRDASSRTQDFGKSIWDDMTSPSADKIIGAHDDLKVLFYKFQESQATDLETGMQLQRLVNFYRGQQGIREERIADLGLLVQEKQHYTDNLSGFVIDELANLRQDAFTGTANAAAYANGDKPSLGGFVDYIMKISEGGYNDAEVDQAIKLVRQMKNNFLAGVDTLGNERLGDKSIRAHLGTKFNDVVKSEEAFFDKIVQDLLGKDINTGMLALEKTKAELRKERRFNELDAKFKGLLTNAEIISKSMGENWFDTVMKHGNILQETGLATALKEILLTTTATLAGEGNDITLEEVANSVTKAQKGIPDKAAAAEWKAFFKTAGAQMLSENSEIARNTIEKIARSNPSEFLSHFSGDDSSRISILQSIANPNITKRVAKEFGGTDVWKGYKNFVVHSLGSIPGVRIAANDFRDEFGSWVDSTSNFIDYRFNEATFSFEMELLDNTYTQNWSNDAKANYTRAKTNVDMLNRYLAILEPIHEEEGEDAALFLDEVFQVFQFDPNLSPVVKKLRESLQQSMGENGETLESQMSTHSPHDTTEDEEITFRETNMANAESAGDVEGKIRQAAEQRGINPDVAVRVARSEGLAPGVWQSNYRKGGIREPSYGPFQLLVGGPGTGFPKGLGNKFIEETGLDPSDPANIDASIEFALDQALAGGWSPWYGASKVGIGRWQGIKD